MSNCTRCLYEWGPDDICPPGLILPIFDERSWNTKFRALLYFLASVYFFLGVTIVTDLFMASIEAITSTTRKVFLAKTEESRPLSQEQFGDPEFIEVRVWNDTVANLTLVALGTSAPEIMLALVEIVKHNFESENLGPSTIVGSAAYNLLVITSLCMISLEPGEVRRIERYGVFVIPLAFSILSYVWILIVVRFISPGRVTVFEALFTFLLFPVLVAISYLADRGWCGLKVLRSQTDLQMELGSLLGERSKEEFIRKQFKGGKINKDNLAQFIREVKNFSGVSDEEAAAIAVARLMKTQPHSSGWYRIGAVRQMTGGRRIQPVTNPRFSRVIHSLTEKVSSITEGTKTKERENKAIVEFRTASISVREDIGRFPVTIVRHGNLDSQARVRVKTIEGSAKAGEDYLPINEIVTFEPHQNEQNTFVEIVHDDVWEPEEEFYIRLSILPEEGKTTVLGPISVIEVKIVDDQNPGTIGFKKRGILVKESAGSVKIPVIRSNGTDGEVSVKWKTIDFTARSGKEFIGGSGTLIFKDTESKIVLSIPVINNYVREKNQYFEVELFGPTNGASLGRIKKIAVTISDDEEYDNVMERLVSLANNNIDSMNIHHKTWTDQIKTAMSVNGGDTENADCIDYTLHFFSFFWKVLFALHPPPKILNGWLCFFVSLFSIAAMTAVIGDIATIFGCLVGLHDTITAITLVSIGTSLPDTLACRMVTKLEPIADGAMIHATGSIAVNCLLGVGLPWLLAAVYHYLNGTVFYVPTESLGFSVFIYSIVSILAFILLFVRRKSSMFGKAEIGGPTRTRYISSAILLSLWVLYILLSWINEVKLGKLKNGK